MFHGAKICRYLFVCKSSGVRVWLGLGLRVAYFADHVHDSGERCTAAMISLHVGRDDFREVL